MDPLDDLDARVREAARADPSAVDRISRAALSDKAGGRGLRGAFLVAVLVLLAAVFATWWARTPQRAARTVLPLTIEAAGDAVTLRAPDGTTWLFAGAGIREYLPAGTCVVIAAGGTP